MPRKTKQSTPQSEQAQPPTKTSGSPFLMIVGALVVLALVFVLVISFFNESTSQLPQNVLEVTETDVFTNENFTSKDIAVKGVMLGMSREEAIDRLGQPDVNTPVSDRVENLEFGTSLGLSETGIILQFIDNKVAKMTLKPAFNDFLYGDTKVNHGKEELLLLLGAPDKADILPFEKDGSKAFRLFTYTDRGIQVAVRNDGQLALSFMQ